MDFLSNLENNSILIIPFNLKEKILEYIDEFNILITIKIMSFNDLKKGLMYDYNNESINAVMKKYQVNYGVACNYINDTYHIDSSNSPKMNFLREIKDYLDSEGLLIYDELFIHLLKHKKNIYVYGFDYITKFNKSLLDKASLYCNINIIDKDYKEYKHSVYEFFTLSDEVSFVAEEISKLIDKGIPLNKIYIANYSDEYYFTFKRIFRSYNIPYYIKNESSIYDTTMGSYLLSNLEKDKELLLYKLRKAFSVEENQFNSIVYNKIVSLINSYYWCDDLTEIKELLQEELKNTKIPSKHTKEEIKTVNIIDNVFNDDEYVFLIGFNLSSVPKLKRDEDYLSDDIKPSTLETSYEYNNIIKDMYFRVIKNIKNIVITYKLSSAFSTYYPSFLIDNNYLIKEKRNVNISEYSNDINRYRLAQGVDNLIKFGDTNETLEILHNNYAIPYKTYDNKWTGINNQKLIELIDNKINFSYSNISTYYECPFKFYVRNILKVQEFEETFEQFIGTLFHHVLETCLSNDTKDIDQVYDEFILNYNEYQFTNKDKFFIKFLKGEIHFIIETIKEQYRHSSHTEEWKEKRIEIDKQRKIKTKVKGFVDKLLVLNNSVIIVDYKTNNTEVKPDLFEFGLSLQLPIYLYLLKCLDSNIEVAGMYMQHILDLKMEHSATKDVITEKKNRLKLCGITIKDINLISKFDDTYEASEVIRSLKITKKDNDFSKSKNHITKDERDELTNLVEKLIDNAIDLVSDGVFDIHPIMIYGSANGCDYCELKDICYRKYKDFNIQKLPSKGDDDNE